MNVLIIATKSCHHRPEMERWLREMDLDYHIVYIEDEPERAERFQIQHSPSLIIDEELIFEGMPSFEEFEQRLSREVALNPSSGSVAFGRLPAREEPQQLPQPVPDAPGLYRVDATWGTIQPMHAAEGVRTVDELEVIEHLRQGRPVVDARTRDFNEQATVPGVVNIPHPEVVAHLDELDRTRQTIFFCNGPQCGQSRTAIDALLEAGYPADKILYYRGGMHDWITLGLPIVPGAPDG